MFQAKVNLNTEITGASIGIIEEKVSQITLDTNQHQDESNFRSGCREKDCPECVILGTNLFTFTTTLVIFVLKKVPGE